MISIRTLNWVISPFTSYLPRNLYWSGRKTAIDRSTSQEWPCRSLSFSRSCTPEVGCIKISSRNTFSYRITPSRSSTWGSVPQSMIQKPTVDFRGRFRTSHRSVLRDIHPTHARRSSHLAWFFCIVSSRMKYGVLPRHSRSFRSCTERANNLPVSGVDSSRK